MSLTSYLRRQEVIARIRAFRPRQSRQIRVPLRVTPRSNRYISVGRAFDYMLRFALKKKAPHAKASLWVAETAPTKLYVKKPDMEGEGVLAGYALDLGLSPEKVARTMEGILIDARRAYEEYLRTENSSRKQMEDLAGHCILLGNLEALARGDRFDPEYQKVHNEDVADILDMIEIVPFDELIDRKFMLLNPIFGEYSATVGGADADLISGESLYDFKATKRTAMEVADLDQLLGYYILSLHYRKVGSAMPLIRTVGLYFARYGLLWKYDTANWQAQDSFADLSEWFVQYANQLLSESVRRASKTIEHA